MTNYTQAKLRFNAWNTLYQAWRKRYLAAAIAATLATLGGGAFAAPTGAEFLKGAGNVGVAGTATTVNITAADATRARASTLINWKGGFNVGAGESVHFNNAVPTAAKLSVINVDNTGARSVIDGTLTSSTGQRATTVHVVNPNGVAIGATANINVGGGFTAIAGKMETANCATLPCVPITYADGQRVDVVLTSAPITVSPAASIKVGGSWDFTELNTLSTGGTIKMTTPGGQTTLPFGKYSGSLPTDGVIDLQSALAVVVGQEGQNLYGPLRWVAKDTAVSSTKYALPQGTDLTLDNTTINGGVTMTWGGKSGNLLLRNVKVTDTATRSGNLFIDSYQANPDASVRVQGLVLDASNGFGAILNLSNLLTPLDVFSATGIAGAARPSIQLLDSTVRGPITIQGSVDATAATRPAPLQAVSFADAGFDRAADNRLAITLGNDVNFKLAPNIGAADYVVSNVDITGGKSVSILNTNVPSATGAGVSTGLLKIDGLTVQGTGDMSIKSGTTGLVLANSNLAGTGSLEVNTKGLETADMSFGGKLSTDNLTASFDKGVKLFAFEEMDLNGSYLATKSGDITVGNQYRGSAIAGTSFESETGNITLSGGIGRMDVNGVSLSTAGDVSVSNGGFAIGSPRSELALTCATPTTCNFDGTNQVGQLHMAQDITINAKNLTIAGDNVNLSDARITVSGNVALSADNQLQVSELRGFESTSTAPGASIRLSANVLLFSHQFPTPVTSDTASLNLAGTSVLKVDGLNFQSQSGAFDARSEAADIRMANSTAITGTGGAEVFSRTGQVVLDATLLGATGKGDIRVSAGKDLTMTGSSLVGEAAVVATSTGGNISLTDSQAYVNMAGLYNPQDPTSVASGILLSAANGTINLVNSSVTLSPTFYAQDANGNYLAQDGVGTVRIQGDLATKNHSGLFGDKALVTSNVQDDGTHQDVWTGEASPIKTTAAVPSYLVSLSAKSISMDAGTVVAGANLPAATPPVVVTPPVVTPPVVTPPVVTPEPPVVVPPVVTPPVVTPPVVTPEPPVVVPPVVTPPVVTPPVVVPEPTVVVPPVVEPPVVVPPVVTPEPPVVVVPPVVVPPVVVIPVPPVVVEPPVLVVPPVVTPPAVVVPPVAIKPVFVPVVIVSTRVEVADVATPTMRADVVLVPNSSGPDRGVTVKNQASKVEMADKKEKDDKR